MNILAEVVLSGPVLGLDWAYDEATGEVTLGAATRSGTFHIIDPEDCEIQESIELTPTTPIWRVAGNHHGQSDTCSFGLATLEGGVLGVQRGQGVAWQHPFSSFCGELCFIDRPTDGTQLLVAGSLDRSLRRIDPKSGQLIWGQMFPTGVGFVERWDLGNGLVLVTGDTTGEVRGYDAFSGTMLWHTEFGQCAAFARPVKSDETREETQWMVGTDDKMVHIFPVNGSKSELASDISAVR